MGKGPGPPIAKPFHHVLTAKTGMSSVFSLRSRESFGRGPLAQEPGKMFIYLPGLVFHKPVGAVLRLTPPHSHDLL